MFTLGAAGFAGRSFCRIRLFFDSLSPAAGRSFCSGNSAETGPADSADSAGTGSAFPGTDCVS